MEPVSLPKDIVTKGPTIPILPIKDPETMRVMDGEKGKGAYATLREARGNVKVVGIRVKAAEKKKSGF